MKTNYFFLMLAGVVLSLVLSSCDPQPIKDILSNEPVFNLDTFENNIIKALDGKTVGYSYSISKGGAMVRKGAGGAAVAAWDRPTGAAIPHASNKRQDLASCSKTITALTVMRLLQDKGLTEKTKMVNYLPAFWDKPAFSFNDITIEQLLTHKSGILPNGLDYFSLKSLTEGGGIFITGNYNYQNVNYALLRVVIAYLSHGSDLKLLEDKYLDEPTNANEVALENAINKYYIEQVNSIVFAPCNIPYTEPKPDGETNPTMNYNFNTQDPGWNKGDMTRFVGSAGWRLSAEEQNHIMARLKYSEQILNETWKQKMNDLQMGWSGMQDLKGGKAYYHGGYFEDKFGPNQSPDPKQRGCFTIHVLFGNGYEAAVQVNSLGGTNNMENTVIPAYNAAWVKPKL